LKPAFDDRYPAAASAHARASAPADSTVPWTFRQTWLGLLIPLIPWLLLSLLAMSQGSRQPQLTAPLSPAQDGQIALVEAITTLLIEGAFLAVSLGFAHRALQQSRLHAAASPMATQEPAVRLPVVLRSLGLRGFRLGVLWLVPLFLVVLYATNDLYSTLIQVLHLPLETNDQVILESSRYAPITTYTVLALAVFVAPLCEEIFFRGFMLPGLQRGLPTGWAIVISALIFGIAHADLGSLPVLVVIGLLLAILRQRSGSLYPGLLLHILNNGLSAALILLSMAGLLRLP
jgi:membrane protease YdiL (CAAX protease family)